MVLSYASHALSIIYLHIIVSTGSENLDDVINSVVLTLYFFPIAIIAFLVFSHVESPRRVQIVDKETQKIVFETIGDLDLTHDKENGIGVRFPVVMDILRKVYNHINNIITFMAKLSDGHITYKDTTAN